MGLDYSYDLYFPRKKLWEVLEAVAALQWRDDRPPLEIVLPDRKISLPFTSHFKSEPLIFNEEVSELYFDTCLYFEVDTAISAYIENRRDVYAMPSAFDDSGRFALGYIYLYIQLGLNKDVDKNSAFKTDTISFSFGAATTAMSRLFEESESVRNTFIRLLEQHDGIAGYFDDETCNGPLIWPPSIVPDDFETFRKLVHGVQTL